MTRLIIFTLLSFFISTALQAELILKNVPHIKQKPDFCGEACVAMFLNSKGHKISQDDVFNSSELSPLKARGCYAKELHKALKNLNFEPGPTWYHSTPAKANKTAETMLTDIKKKLSKGIPSIVCTRYSNKPGSSEHFRLITGYDKAKEEIIYHEPAEKNGAYRRMKKADFFEIWPLKYSKEKWTYISFALDLKNKPPVPKNTSFTDADYAQHIMKLKKKVPAGFHITIQKPFIVIGDEDKETVEKRSKGTVKWAINRLKASYFKKDPKFILDIWLFKNKGSYEKNTRGIFKDKPGTPFGYYSSRLKSLIMNISTCCVTLVHEIVHPFIESNFEKCPSWFNEGLASLYEQCGDKNGKIHGFVNWRLRGLKAEIKTNTLPSFKDLCATTTMQFYNSSKGNNYAQARYLCYYLQEKGLLQGFYKSFTADVKEDPTGYKTLQKILKTDDMKTFKSNWQQWCQQLK